MTFRTDAINRVSTQQIPSSKKYPNRITGFWDLQDYNKSCPSFNPENHVRTKSTSAALNEPERIMYRRCTATSPSSGFPSQLQRRCSATSVRLCNLLNKHVQTRLIASLPSKCPAAKNNYVLSIKKTQLGLYLRLQPYKTPSKIALFWALTQALP